MKKLVVFLLTFFLLFAVGCVPVNNGGANGGGTNGGGSGGGGTPPEPPPTEISPSIYVEDDYKFVDKSRLFGIAEPFYEMRQNGGFQVRGFNDDVTIDLLQAMGVKSLRLMLPIDIFDKYAMYGENDFEVELDQEKVAYFKSVIQKLYAAGIEHLICEVPIYPKPAGFAGGYQSLTAPSRTDEYYGDWCLLLEEQWRVIAETFTEIRYFELGNETNMHIYLSQANGKHFSFEENIAINTDLLYYASRGVRKGNPNAYTTTPGYTSLGTVGAESDSMTSMGYSIYNTLDQLYKNIESGNFPYGEEKSVEIDDYFNAISLHTYEYTHWDDFEESNDRVFNLINSYDNGRKVFITEVGWPDADNESTLETHCTMVTELYEYYASVPQVETVCYFRLYNCDYASNWGSYNECTFGLFEEPSDTVGFVAKEKAKVLQTYFNGEGDLDMWKDIGKLNEKLNTGN